MRVRKRLAQGARLAGLPEEVLLGVPRAVLMGTERVLIENHKGVLSYDADRLRVRTPCGVLQVDGADLRLESFGGENLAVQGRIDRMGYRMEDA
ncbi:MAG: hypothetical protein LBU67_09450 [Oscillospiraceae bacterium]|jgi:sporulation protein YqfC|nr:hypothetical protein [Oscillospiraceae bacterium]